VEDPGEIPALLLGGGLENLENGLSAGERAPPVAPDGRDIAEVDENSVLDGLGTGVRVDAFTERMFDFHELVPFGTCSWVQRAPLSNTAVRQRCPHASQSAP